MESTTNETIREAPPQVSAGSTAKLIREVRTLLDITPPPQNLIY